MENSLLLPLVLLVLGIGGAIISGGSIAYTRQSETVVDILCITKFVSKIGA